MARALRRLLAAVVLGLGLAVSLLLGSQSMECESAPRAVGSISGAASSCSSIYQDAAWTVSSCPTDPNVSVTMTVWLDGMEQAEPATHVEIAHITDDGSSRPTVAVLYASGYVRLKQNADPTPSIPFGSSFVLGPAYWSDSSTYHHNPSLTSLALDTARLPNGPLRLQARGINHDFALLYDLVLPPPHDRQTRLHVVQTYTATGDVSIDATRRAKAQGFKLVQVSSMYVGEGGACDGGHTDCHDSDAARFIGDDLVRHQVAFADLAPSAFVFSTTAALSSTWLDALHTDDASWQGNTPNVRIALDALPDDRTVTPQGWISATTNPDDDNVGLWLHDDGAAAQSWAAGQSDAVSYWLMAQDDPPEPWADLGLRTGHTFLNFEGSFACSFIHDLGQPVTGTLAIIPGYADTALQLSYSLGVTNGHWSQIRCDFNPPLDLSDYDHLRFDWRGDPGAANTLQVGLIDQVTTTQRIFAANYGRATHRGWWGQMVIPFDFLQPWEADTTLDSSRVAAFILSVVKNDGDDGGTGSIAIDNLNAYNVASRAVPVSLSAAASNTVPAGEAAQWLASQQQPTGLLKSWEADAACIAHTYDQAVALVAFSREGMWAQADAIVEALAEAQNDDGSWFKSYDCGNNNLPCVHCHKWEGDIAWAVHALGRYRDLGGTRPEAKAAMCKGARWLTERIDTDDGCLTIDHTEGTIDAWWALQAAGHSSEAEMIENCLLTTYWDEEMGRFKGGKDWWQPYLDNQTWGAAFLQVVGEETKARRALSYAAEVLRAPSQGGQLFGYDGQAGPWAMWNEGTAQYAAVGGAGAGDLRQELLAQQHEDGAMPGSPDDYTGGGVWVTRWRGVAPTAWLYFALSDEPFHPGAAAHCPCIYLPLVLRDM